ncbi:MAG: stage III sporulation protein AE [Oscillospiraceae bacterium]|nr:stage III sporulation protein AE [Oscillospiraceae bacterium]
MTIPVLSVSAEGLPETSDDLSELERAVNEEIVNALPPEVGDRLTDINPLELTFGGVMAEVWEMLKSEVTRPLQLLVSLVGVIILCAAANALRDSGGGAAKSTAATAAFEIVGVLAGAGLMSAAIAQNVLRTSQTLTAAGAFMLTFIPILAGIMAVMGNLISANLFSTAVVAAAQIFSQIMVMVLMPLSASILGVSVAGAVNPDLKTDKLAETVKTITVWVLGFSATIFSALLGLQSLVAGNADSVAMKAVKFTISGGVPFIGGAVGDALGVVNGSVGVLKGTTGAVGMIAIVMVCLPPILSTILFRLSLNLAGAVSGLFGTDRLTSLLKSGENVLSVVLAMLVCFTLIMLVSIALMIRIGTGGV